MNYQLLIKNGTVVDPAQGIHACKDVAFANGRVSAVSDTRILAQLNISSLKL